MTEITAGVQTFQDVAIYRHGEFMGNISRTDCKTLTVESGVKWAQYDNAFKITYMGKGKRTARYFMLSYRPWLRVVAIKDAIEPDSMLVPGEKRDGCTVSKGRYSAHDSRWQTDFEDKLAAAGVPVVLSIGSGDRDKCMRCLDAVATTHESGSHVCGPCAGAIREEQGRG